MHPKVSPDVSDPVFLSKLPVKDARGTIGKSGYYRQLRNGDYGVAGAFLKDNANGKVLFLNIE
ncbi:MAG: hypothetical protein ABI707_02980 [Ferruginibacter sp.]